MYTGPILSSPDSAEFFLKIQFGPSFRAHEPIIYMNKVVVSVLGYTCSF